MRTLPLRNITDIENKDIHCCVPNQELHIYFCHNDI